MRVVLVVVALFGLISCTQQVKLDPIPKQEKTFVTYELSEMASLMERMYAESLALQDHVIRKDSNIVVNTSFLKDLDMAALTVPADRDGFFVDQTKEFVAIYESMQQQGSVSKERFNAMVESCLACHRVKCVGPMGRIKKLIIK